VEQKFVQQENLIKLPIGTSDYKEIVDEGYAYVDKTLVIRDLLESGSKATLFTRPRRFGKSLLLSTLRTFFEDERDLDGQKIDNSHYFQGTRIYPYIEKYAGHFGTHPVIYLSFKDIVNGPFESAYISIKNLIVDEFTRHDYILQSDKISERNKKRYDALADGTAGKEDYFTSLKFLSRQLEAYSGRKTVVLIDEYDVPLACAYDNGFYDDMVSFIRILLSSVLKDNPSLAFAVVTGCLRISRESIFTGLNNLTVRSILNRDFDEYFGFMEDEVRSLLDEADLADHMSQVREWYDGYLFGDTEIYNPWSILYYIDEHKSNKDAEASTYWSNTSANSIVRSLIERSSATARQNLETLLQGGQIEVPVREDMVYSDISARPENLWNMLFFTGYLTKVSETVRDGARYITLRIPNREVRSIYADTITEWFGDTVENDVDKVSLSRCLAAGDNAGAQKIFNDLLFRTISFHDSKESFYHGFLSGLLTQLPEYSASSNREIGDGRPDICLMPLDPQKDPVVIMEVKSLPADRACDMDKGADRALEQIAKKRYEKGAGLLKGSRVIAYGICFCGKSCIIKKLPD